MYTGNGGGFWSAGCVTETDRHRTWIGDMYLTLNVKRGKKR